MAISASMVKELRERTSAGMMDCKKALEAVDGDMDKAIEYLREKGLSTAAKKAGRIAAEGLVAFEITEDNKKAAMVEVNSETDFVAKNDLFVTFVNDIAKQALATSSADVESFLAEPTLADGNKTVNDALVEKISVIGENLKIRRFEQMAVEQGAIIGYSHGNGRIGVLVKLETETVNDEVLTCGKNVAMQIAALPPLYLDRSEVDPAYIESEREILKQQAINENPDKPENIIDKMIIGRLNKQLKEVCLMDQVYVRDSDMNVDAYVKSVAKAVGTDIKVAAYLRFETGEGIEKKQENFAEEVAKQMQ